MVPRENPHEMDPEGSTASVPEPARATARGFVSSVAATGREQASKAPYADIVERVFGPGRSEAAESESPAISGIQPQYPDLDLDFSLGKVVLKKACVLGAASKVAGDLVADENVEIQGLVEGVVRARRSRVTVGIDGFVQSRVEARSVRVRGTVRGNVTAEDWIEVKAGGVIRGDVRAPRVILHDGALVTGRLDMTGAIAARRASGHFDPLVIPPRPRTRKVGRAGAGGEPSRKSSADGRGARSGRRTD
jgi:cytoskeletal protein CcmA (bactofilin family)